MTYTELEIGDTVDINGHTFEVCEKDYTHFHGINLVAMQFQALKPYPKFKETDLFYYVYDEHGGSIVAHFNPNSDK